MDELLSTELLRTKNTVCRQLSSRRLGSALANFDEEK